MQVEMVVLVMRIAYIKSCYTDADDDEFGAGAVSSYELNSCGSQLAEDAGDCCDSDSDAYPDSTFLFIICCSMWRS